MIVFHFYWHVIALLFAAASTVHHNDLFYDLQPRLHFTITWLRIQHICWFLLRQKAPAGCPRIYVTNSSEHDFYPKMSVRDETGVKRRQIFVEVVSDLRVCTVAGTFVWVRFSPFAKWHLGVLELANDSTHSRMCAKAPWNIPTHPACDTHHSSEVIIKWFMPSNAHTSLFAFQTANVIHHYF